MRLRLWVVGGAISIAACLALLAPSFNGNKLITTGGGGHCRRITLIWRSELGIFRLRKASHPRAFDHDVVAWNDRMPNSMQPGSGSVRRFGEAVAS